MLLSVCIPTYNRAKNLENCLNSIKIASQKIHPSFVEICISDNASTDETSKVVEKFKKFLNIKYKKNKINLGIPKNFLNVVDMAQGKFIWLIGDDDLLLHNSLKEAVKLLDKNQNLDFFYVNAYHLDNNYLNDFKKPFNTINLPKNLNKFSNFNFDGEIRFLDLISPEVSFDFLGGMFLSIFKKRNWDLYNDVLNEEAINSNLLFSHLDNTFPHSKIFSIAFSQSKAYYNSIPLIVCLSGVREWSDKYPLIRSIRLVELLIEYRKNGLPFFQYIKCRNFALQHFIPDLIRLLIKYKRSGVKSVNILFWLLSNAFYPNFYMSPFIELIKKIKYHAKVK